MNKLDLHGTKHEEVKRKTIRFIESNWGSGSEVEIITGNSFKMQDLVIDVIDEYSLTVIYPVFDSGCLRVFME